jgi:hypothetical protein
VGSAIAKALSKTENLKPFMTISKLSRKLK